MATPLAALLNVKEKTRLRAPPNATLEHFYQTRGKQPKQVCTVHSCGSRSLGRGGGWWAGIRFEGWFWWVQMGGPGDALLLGVGALWVLRLKVRTVIIPRWKLSSCLGRVGCLAAK